MNYEDQEDAEASRPRGRRQQGGLAATLDRAQLGARSSVERYRLKRSTEVFESASGTLHLLRLGAGDDLEIERPSRCDAQLLRRLELGFVSKRELAQASGATPEYVSASIDALGDSGVLEVESENCLSAQQAERFSRQLIYFADLATPPASASALQSRLLSSHVMLIGCGGLGSWVACGLASAGVGALTIVDDDRVELSNLNRQLLFTEDDIGVLKVKAASRALCAHNSALEVTTHAKRLCSQAEVEALLESSIDLVVATADWPPHDLPRWVNAACLDSGTPWLAAGQFPPKLRVGPLVVPGETACLECHEMAIRERHSLYDEVAEWRASRTTPDSSVGPVTGVIGSLLASEALHWLLKAFSPRSAGNAILLDLQTLELRLEPVERRSDCKVCATV